MSLIRALRRPRPGRRAGRRGCGVMIERARTLAGVAAIALALGTAPAAQSRPPDPVAAAAQFQPGVTTAHEVIAILGPPVTETVDSTGVRTIGYASIHAHAKAASFIPIVGLFAGGAVGKSSSVYFTFGPDGILRSYTSQSTRVDCGAVFTGMNCKGAEAPLPPTQPEPQGAP
jgi:hypothetical protein